MTADQTDVWVRLSALLDALPEEDRQAYIFGLHTFIHDLRQPLAQIQSAEELIRLIDIPYLQWFRHGNRLADTALLV